MTENNCSACIVNQNILVRLDESAGRTELALKDACAIIRKLLNGSKTIKKRQEARIFVDKHHSLTKTND